MRTKKTTFWISFTASLILAVASDIVPARRMPLDFDAMLWWSIPLACAWAVVLLAMTWRFRLRGLWLLLGAPLALHWPIWLLFNHFPSCYYSHNCQ